MAERSRRPADVAEQRPPAGRAQPPRHCRLALTLEIGIAAHTARTITGECDLDRAHVRGLHRILARDLAAARHDFRHADLSKVDLGWVSLAGIRWSMATRWPSDEWRAQALLDSRDLGDGTYEIRGGTTDVPTHTT